MSHFAQNILRQQGAHQPGGKEDEGVFRQPGGVPPQRVCTQAPIPGSKKKEQRAQQGEQGEDQTPGEEKAGEGVQFRRLLLGAQAAFLPGAAGRAPRGLSPS